jgi:deoxyribodipyrimidine photo-lyase
MSLAAAPPTPLHAALDGDVRVLLWFKRDLRLADHAPLHAAQRAGAAAALFIFEPAWLASPECDVQHVAFTQACLAPLREALAARGLPLLLRHGSAVAVLQALHGQLRFTHLASCEETGPMWSYDRDRAVRRWCRAQGVTWLEWPQNGVVRPLRSRQGWAARWQARMDAPLLPAPDRLPPPLAPGLAADATPPLAALGLHTPPRALPPAGEAAAQETLHSFLHARGSAYRRALSSPLTAETGCSRLSAHLAFGTVSMRQVHQATEARIRDARSSDAADGIPSGWAHALRGFAGRLRWHCHFMQKLEDEPAIEQRHFARVCDGLRPGEDEATGAPPWDDEAQRRLDAWCSGRTGFPMVDACMRSLNATGWLNFRMRAMLVSFASYQLWLHWRPTGLHLARQFLDFEPGIHWSQMQMQSGTTGINTLRIYSPAKQALDHDPEGLFVRRWVPEFGTPDYPAPIVDERAAVAAAKERLYGLRRSSAARAEADAVQQRHGSRKSGLPPSATKPAGSRRKGAAPDPRQRELF